MFASKILTDLGNLIGTLVKKIYNFIKELPRWWINKIQSFYEYQADFRRRLLNLEGTNMELGRYHLQQGNLNDAIVRFKIVRKLLNPKNESALYYLGWCYFLKNNLKQAREYLSSASASDQVNLKAFVENYTAYEEVPAGIWQECRDFAAVRYIESYSHDKIHLPLTFVQEAVKNISSLPDEYVALELGSNVALAGYEIRKRFPDTLKLIGVETSQKMIDLLDDVYYPNYLVYDKIIHSSVATFLETNKEQFPVIISFCGFGFTKNLKKYLGLVNRSLAVGGYLAICLPINENTEFSLSRKEFVFSTGDIEDALKLNQFKINYENKISLGINNKFAIIAAEKI